MFEAGLDFIEFDKHIRLPGNEYVTPIVAALTRQTVEDLSQEYSEQFASLGVGPLARGLWLVLSCAGPR